MKLSIEWIDNNGRPQFRTGSERAVNSWRNHLVTEGVREVIITREKR